MYLDTAEKVHGDLKDVFVLIILSYNSLFEGLALGLQSSSPTIIILLIIILLYGLIVSMSLSVYLFYQKQQNSNIMFFAITYSAMNAIGIGIGWILEYIEYEVNCLAQAFACGVLLYVSTSQIIAEEFKQLYMKWLKLIMFIIGIVVSVLVWLLEREIQK